jgi:hypothetical protein
MSASVSPCPICTHILPNGHRCGSPAMRGERHCYHHHPTRRPPQRITSRGAAFNLPPIGDRQDLQFALSEIMGRLADNTLDTRRAGLMLQIVQMAAANLGSSNNLM